MISQKSSDERRKDPRLENNIPIRISQEDGDTVTETGNISRSGVYCRVHKYIEPMTKLKINLLLPIRKKGKDLSKKVNCQGVVVRSEKSSQGSDYYVAIFFSEISKRDAESIADYVSSYLES